jgi:hypothetical protein
MLSAAITPQLWSALHDARREDGAMTWHADGISRTRLSTTVEADLLEGARRLRPGASPAGS